MYLLKKQLKLLLALTLLTVAGTLQAETLEEKGLAIAKESKARDIGWGDMQADMKMILRNKQGQEKPLPTPEATWEVGLAEGKSEQKPDPRKQG